MTSRHRLQKAMNRNGCGMFGMYFRAEKVERISNANISAGFDVFSYEVSGNEKFIEVKTTALSKLEFYLSSNEIDIAREYQHRYRIYFLSEIYGSPKLMKIHNPLVEVGKLLSLTPANFRVQLLVP
jgi:uncharacterized protein DUF3883